jgi:uncharacterized protein (DUF736 family)
MAAGGAFILNAVGSYTGAVRALASSSRVQVRPVTDTSSDKSFEYQVAAINADPARLGRGQQGQQRRSVDPPWALRRSATRSTPPWW